MYTEDCINNWMILGDQFIWPPVGVVRKWAGTRLYNRGARMQQCFLSPAFLSLHLYFSLPLSLSCSSYPAPNLFWPGSAPLGGSASLSFLIRSPGAGRGNFSGLPGLCLPGPQGSAPPPAAPSRAPPQHWFGANVWAAVALARLEKGIISVSLHSSQTNSQNGKWPGRWGGPPHPQLR